uniref:HAT C-terminal dimerisation domain-containing protein n=1 Tax=Chenopodium quinoa TaxID=63459 RepID=A0A803N211_CHEQI
MAMKSEMDMYYEEPLMPRSSNIDILAYWRTCSVRYPVLAQMAKDVLAVPVSTVASESAFSTESRVLDCYRSSLKLEIVESFIFLRD